ncbi:MAG: hypothetical protein M3485_01790 [Pseudomonadota bacterium]|nr:hypothetical protein [Pseudomonadota bacterium]
MAICATSKIKPALVQESAAVRRLRPDLGDRIVAGELELADVRADVHCEFMRLVFEQAQGVES